MFDKRPQRREFLVTLGYEPSTLDNWLKLWTNKKVTSRDRDIKCLLTFEDYVELAHISGITHPNQIGRKEYEFQLGRIGDVGDYAVSNCRFITKHQNTLEKIENGGTQRQANKLRGRTKQDSDYLRSSSNKQTGRNKHTHKQFADISERMSKEFIVFSPSGERFEGKNLTAFCEEYGLRQGLMCMVCLGKRKHHKGWTGRYADANPV